MCTIGVGIFEDLEKIILKIYNQKFEEKNI